MSFSYQFARAAVTVDCVVFGLDDEDLKVLLIRRDLPPFEDKWALPGGFVRLDETLDEAARRELQEETSLERVFLEQLYTFGDKGREAPVADMGQSSDADRVVSVGYIALAGSIDEGQRRAGVWADWYRFFPWEDRRSTAGMRALDLMMPDLNAWATTTDRQSRVAMAFGLHGQSWQESQVLDRFELLYEAGLVQ